MVFDEVPEDTRLWKPRNSTARNRYEEYREQCAELFVCKARKYGKIHCWVSYKQSYNRPKLSYR